MWNGWFVWYGSPELSCYSHCWVLIMPLASWEANAWICNILKKHCTEKFKWKLYLRRSMMQERYCLAHQFQLPYALSDDWLADGSRSWCAETYWGSSTLPIHLKNVLLFGSNGDFWPMVVLTTNCIQRHNCMLMILLLPVVTVYMYY